jgi:hypothetical protein
MKTYKVTITEKLQMTVEVEAHDRTEAECLVEERWNDSDYILDADHFTGASFKAEPLQRERDYER